MTDLETCNRCGHKGRANRSDRAEGLPGDIRLRLVRYDSEIVGKRGMISPHFMSEWRCQDVAACDRRASFAEVVG